MQIHSRNLQISTNILHRYISFLQEDIRHITPLEPFRLFWHDHREGLWTCTGIYHSFVNQLLHAQGTRLLLLSTGIPPSESPSRGWISQDADCSKEWGGRERKRNEKKNDYKNGWYQNCITVGNHKLPAIAQQVSSSKRTASRVLLWVRGTSTILAGLNSREKQNEKLYQPTHNLNPLNLTNWKVEFLASENYSSNISNSLG